jgi:threonine dehydrogenase-like Zn-dependent dehydrogenase
MASGRVDMRPVITSRFQLPQADAAVEKASKRQDGKVMVKMA